MKNTVIVTGANGNLGKAVVQAFLQQGWNVIGTIRKESETNTLPDHERLDIRVVDMLKESEVEEMTRKLIDQYKNINAGVFTVGGFAMGNLADSDSNDIQRQIDLNFKTAYHICRPLYLHMREKQSGRLVFIGSRPALEPQRALKVLPYALSKSLLFSLADTINSESHDTNIVATVIAPDTIDTPENREQMPDANKTHWVAPEAIAEIITFISGSAGKPLSQNVLKVYG